MLKIFFISITALIFSLIPCTSNAQADTAALDKMVSRGAAQYIRRSYDSSLAQFQTALSWVRKHNMLTNPRALIIYNFIGDNYVKKNDPTRAHHHYMLALQESRRLNIASEKITALV